MDKIKSVYQKAYASFNNHEHKKRWQGGIGVTVIGLFVLSSLLFSTTISAVNQIAGNYGYYKNQYGYYFFTVPYLPQSSDAVPRAPTALTSSSVGTSSATVSWTAPTTTVSGTSLNNLADYLFHYNTSSLTSCSGGTSSTPTSATKSLTGLTSGTTYYVAVCTRDSNFNTSSALTGSFTTTSEAGAAAGGGGGAAPVSVANIVTTTTATTATTTATTTGPAVTTLVPAVITQTSVSSAVASDAAKLVVALNVKRDTTAEATYATKVAQGATEFRVTLTAEVKVVATNFATYGTTNIAVQKLGAGERLAVARDVLATLGNTVANDASKFLLAAEQISSGQKPSVRNVANEVKVAGVARDVYWKKLTGRSAPNFKNKKDDLAWNTMLYRVRFARDLNKERAGITKFKAAFKKNPSSPSDWAAVRAWGYVLGAK